MAIKTKPNGKFQVDTRDKYGNRIQKTFRTKAEAKAFDGANEKSKYDEKLISAKLLTARYPMNQALDDFLASKIHLRPASIKKNKYVITQMKLVAKVFNVTYVDEFTPDHATKLYNELVREKPERGKNNSKMAMPKPKTINFFIQTVKAVFNQEVIKGHIKQSPMMHIKNLKVDKKKPDYYSPEEIKLFFQQQMNSAYRKAFLGLLFTGARFGELANLTWDDIDFKNRLIHIRSSENFKTKSFNSERNIPMHNLLYELLLEEHKKPNAFEFPFCSPSGKKLRERNLLTVCKKVAKAAGINTNAYLHKFRHTFASMLVQNGVPIHSVKELLGHWSVVQTEIYAHHKAELLHQEVSSLKNLLP